MSQSMNFREAGIDDISGMHVVRVAVKENPLPDPGMITTEDYADFLVNRGKGWLCETGGSIIGFAIADLEDHNVWALFITPGHEGKGVGKRLQQLMLDWYFNQTDETIWLGTSPGTRAEQFYRLTGWKQTGIRSNGEIRFEMSAVQWSISNRQ